MNTRRPVLHDYGGGEMLDYDHSVVPATEADDPAQPILQYAEYVKASYELARVQLWSNPVVAAMSRLRTIIS